MPRRTRFDHKEDGRLLDPGVPSPRPKDAATLILIRVAPLTRKTDVLVGKRSSRHAFMPDKYVFPGGRVEAFDGRVPAANELHHRSEAQLAVQTRRRARAFALTAIRETFEETGLIVGVDKPSPKGALPADWHPYFERGAVPDLHGLRFVGRAITPPYRPKRFDARFFMANADDVLIDDRPPEDGAELSDLQWVDLETAMGFDLPSVTRFMIGEIGERVANPSAQPKPAFLRWTNSGHQMTRIF